MPLLRSASHTARGLLATHLSLLDCCLLSCFRQLRPQTVQWVSSPDSTWRCQAQLCPQAQETHLRVRVMARNWCGKPLIPGAAAATQAGGPDLQSSKEWWSLPSWPRRKFLLGSALWRRYEKPGIQGFPGQVQRNVRAPRLKSFKTKTRAGYRKQPVKHWLEQKT